MQATTIQHVIATVSFRAPSAENKMNQRMRSVFVFTKRGRYCLTHPAEGGAWVSTHSPVAKWGKWDEVFSTLEGFFNGQKTNKWLPLATVPGHKSPKTPLIMVIECLSEHTGMFSGSRRVITTDVPQ